MFKNRTEYNFNMGHYFPNLDRHKSFNATAKVNDDGVTYRVHMWADYVKSVDVPSTALPIHIMTKMFDDWVKEVSKKEI